jgi:hypothetical protein
MHCADMPDTIEFAVGSQKWKDRTHAMYGLKEIFNSQGWKNGSDYLFVRPIWQNNTIPVRFLRPEHVTTALLMYHGQ